MMGKYDLSRRQLEELVSHLKIEWHAPHMVSMTDTRTGKMGLYQLHVIHNGRGVMSITAYGPHPRGHMTMAQLDRRMRDALIAAAFPFWVPPEGWEPEK